MSFRWFSILIKVMVVSLLMSLSFSETAWVGDARQVTLRKGPGNQYESIKTLNSGTELTVLERAEEEGYRQVETSTGEQGWVLVQYLTKQPTTSADAVALDNKVKRLQQTLAAIDDKYNQMLNFQGDEVDILEQLVSEKEIATKELSHIRAVSDSALQLDQDYKKLAEDYARIKNELDVLQAENRSISEFNDNKMLTLGALLIIVGLAIGFFIPKMMAPKRRRDVWS